LNRQRSHRLSFITDQFSGQNTTETMEKQTEIMTMAGMIM